METTFFQDFQKLLDSFEALKKTKDNPYFKSKYVPLEVILPLAKTHAKENNFLFMQFPGYVEGKNILFTKFIHQSGEAFEGSIEIVAKDAGDPQKVGAGMTYMRRYSLSTMLGLEEEDDDGNTASGKNDEFKKQDRDFTDAMKKLRTAKNLEELKILWKGLSKAEQGDSEVQGVKEELKNQLT